MISVFLIMLFKYSRKNSIMKALYHCIGTFILGGFIFALCWYEIPLLATKPAILLISITFGIVIWYLGEQLFPNEKNKIQTKANLINEVKAEKYLQIKTSPIVLEKNEFKWVLANKSQINNIVAYMNLHVRISSYNIHRYSENLAYGVTDRKRKVYVTMIDIPAYSTIQGNNLNLHKYTYIVDGKVLIASCTIQRGQVANLQVNNKYREIVHKAIVFYNSEANHGFDKAFRNKYPNTPIYKYQNILKKECLSVFKEETLSYYDELDASLQNTLQIFCDVLNKNGIQDIFLKAYSIDSFKSKYKYSSVASRYINYKGDIWLYCIGCTDGTHAPADFLESEWLLFYYKKFAIRLNFEENKKGNPKFKLDHMTINMHIITKSQLDQILEEEGFDQVHYYHMLQLALNVYRSNYYDLTF